MDGYVNLSEALPVDTLAYKADGISLVISLAPDMAPDGSDALLPQLLIRTRDGAYRFIFGKSVLEDLLSQCLELSRFTPQDYQAMLAGLTQRNEGEQ